VPILIAALLLVPLIVLAFVLLIPFALVQRYRVATSRRRVRPWLAVVNVVGISLSMVFFLIGAAVTNIWVPDAFVYACLGAALGMAAGVLGLALTRWDVAAGARHYTPNRWLVLLITTLVAGRIAYGIWRSWHAWQVLGTSAAWAAASGVAGSLAAGAAILGYYFVYWIGIRLRS
jgi:hypothetical protein